MDESTSYPPIEPSNFDLIVIGTGLPESLISAAASAAGKSVLNLDTNPFYGNHYTSLPFSDFISFLQSQSQSHPETSQTPQNDASSTLLLTRPMYSDLEISSYSSELIENSRKFNIDVSGPRILFCSDSMIDLILRTGINQYMEFKSIDASFVSDVEGSLRNVPDSRKAIFSDRSLSFVEKNQLMKVFKRVQGHFAAEGSGEEDRISEEDLQSPFVEFLNKCGLSQKLKSIILHAIVLADYDQENLEACKDVISTKSGIGHLALYNSSIGRFPNASGAMIYPIYGQGELPQAFCRKAAVKGCTHVLRMPIVEVLMDEDGATYKGVKLASGQELSSTRLLLAPSFAIARSLASAHVEDSYDVGLRIGKRKVARGVCITKNSVKPDMSNCLVFFPPRSLYEEQYTAIRVLQLSSNLAVSAPGMFVIYLSSMCDNATEGKKSLNAAMKALFNMPACSISEKDGIDHPASSISESDGIDHPSAQTDTKPRLLWSASYIQELTLFQEAFDSITYTPFPDEHLHYSDLLNTTEKLFQEIYPGEEFLPVTSSSNENPDGASSEQN